MGQPQQLLRPDSPGFQAGRWVITLLLSGISYFRPLYLYHGNCSVMLPDANSVQRAFPQDHLLPADTGKVALGSGWAARPTNFSTQAG